MRTGRITAQVLLGGVLVSFGLLTAGLAAYFLTGRADEGRLVRLGLAVLLATPFMRLLALTGEFARRREYAFVVVAIGVLLLLVISIQVGLR